jgi:hypothetical protein
VKRYNFHLPEPLLEALRAESARTGIKLAEIIRMALMEYIKK